MSSRSALRIVEMPNNQAMWNEVAEWSIREWGADFPEDTAQTYVALYAESCRVGDALPKVYVAVDAGHGSQVLGTVTLVDDDELPGAIEPGPWLAALYVRSDMRGGGLGQRLVAHCTGEARRLGFSQMWLYTPQHRTWYEEQGWRFVRRASLHRTNVDVLNRTL